MSVVASFGLSLTVLVAIVLVETNLTRTLGRTLPERAPALYFIDIQPDQVAPFDALVRATPGVGALRRIPMLRGRIVSVNGIAPEDMEIPPEIAWVFRGDRGLTWSREAPPNAEITAGDWWPPDYAGPPLLSLDAQVADALGLTLGDRIGVNLLGREVEAEIANLRAQAGREHHDEVEVQPGPVDGHVAHDAEHRGERVAHPDRGDVGEALGDRTFERVLDLGASVWGAGVWAGAGRALAEWDLDGRDVGLRRALQQGFLGTWRALDRKALSGTAPSIISINFRAAPGAEFAHNRCGNY